MLLGSCGRANIPQPRQARTGEKTFMLNGVRQILAVLFGTPPDDALPCVTQANSFREVVSLQALFVTLTVALLAYVNSEPVFQLRVDALFTVLASLPVLGLYTIVSSRVRTESGDVYVCTRPIRAYARQAMLLDIAIVAGVSLLYWWGRLPGQ
jgi:hypothetical protein